MALGSIVVSLLMQTATFETDARRAAQIAERRAKEIDAAFTKAGNRIGIALGGAITGVAYAVNRTIRSMDELAKAASRAGMGVPEFSKLAHAAGMANVSVGELQTATAQLARSQSLAAAGTGRQAEVFQRLGIQVRDSSGALRSASEVMAEFADKVAQATESDHQQMLADGMTLFGRSFQSLIPLLRGGSEGFREAAAEAEKLGLVLSDQAAADAERFNNGMARLGLALKGITIQFANELIPVVISAQERLMGWLESMGGVSGVYDKMRDAAGKLLAVITSLTIYIATRWVVGLVAATAAMVAKIAATAQLTAATVAWTAAMTAARLVAATLFGPVGLIALGAVALYQSATATTAAEEAALKHRDVMAQINGMAPASIEAALGLAAAKRREAAGTLEAARAILAERQAILERDAAIEKRTASFDIHMGRRTQMWTKVSARRVAEAQEMVTEIERQIGELDAKMAELRVSAAVDEAISFLSPVFETPDPPTKPGGGTQKDQVDELTKAYERQLEALQKRAFLLANTGDDAALRYELELGALRGLDEARAQTLLRLNEEVTERERLADAMKEGEALTNRMMTRTERAAEAVSRAAELYELGAISLETYNRVMESNQSPARRLINDLQEEYRLLGLTNEQREIANALRMAGVDATEAEREEIVRTIEAMQEFHKVREMADRVGGAFVDMFDSINTGAKAGKEAMRDFLNEITRMIVEFLVQKAVQQFVQWIVGFWSPGATAGAGAGGGGGFVGPQSTGGPKIQAFAMGGIVDSPTFFNSRSGPGVAGEAGTEAILPVSRGKDGKLGVSLTGGTGATSVYVSSQVNVDNSGGRGSEADAERLGDIIKREVEATTMTVITREQRQGGALWRMRYG